MIKLSVTNLVYVYNKSTIDEVSTDNKVGRVKNNIKITKSKIINLIKFFQTMYKLFVENSGFGLFIFRVRLAFTKLR